MQITATSWNNYISRLSRLNQKAAQQMQAYLDQHGTGDREALIAYAHALITRYSEGSAELACQMYDALAAAEGVTVPPAEPAEPASYREVAKMVNATKDSPPQLQRGVSRLVKRAGADTTLQNAKRDGAEFAWIPHGDTCAFCLTLASRGWQRASAKVLKGGHAEHIHAHCDCEFAIRFSSGTNVAGYDPEKYLQQYREAGGDINKMRRIDYAANKDRINAQKRAAYAAKKAATLNETLHMEPQPVTMKSISDVKPFACETLDSSGQRQLQNAHKHLLMTAFKQPSGVEVGRVFDLRMKPLTQDIIGASGGHSVRLPDQNEPYVAIHTHPACGNFSNGDLSNFANNSNLKLLTAVGHNGHVYAIEKTASYNAAQAQIITNKLRIQISKLVESDLSNEQVLTEAESVISECIKELQNYGVKFYE